MIKYFGENLRFRKLKLIEMQNYAHYITVNVIIPLFLVALLVHQDHIMEKFQKTRINTRL